MNKKMKIDEKTFTDRSIAAMVALGVGDAGGDLGRDDETRRRYGIITKLLPECRSTDDTEFTVLTARALLDNKDNYTAKAVADTWRELVLSDGGAKKRAGMPLYGALWNLSQGMEPPISGIDNTLNNDDGAAMRAVPFGIIANGDPAEAARLAAIDASVSHYKDGIWGAQAVAASIAVALHGGSVDEVIEAGKKYIPDDSWFGRRMKIAMDILEDISDPFEQYALLHTKLWAPYQATVPEAIPQFYALYKMAKGDFRRGFILSANFGRDADTICALTLALCAAGQGLSVIPDEWVEQVRYPAGVCLGFAAKEDLVDLAKRLAKAALEVSKEKV